MDLFTALDNKTNLPTIHVLSDSVGLTAQSIAKAAAVQYGVSDPCIETISKVRNIAEVREFFEKHQQFHAEHTGSARMLVFYTLVDRKLAAEFEEFVKEHDDIIAVDVLTPAIDAISSFTGMKPSNESGKLRAADHAYFKRIEAMEFTIDHDDGRNPQDLVRADIVLVGVSRSSKTPLSIFLSQRGYKVANVPLDLQTEPPSQLFDVDKTRLFGLMTSAEVLVPIRKRRIGNALPVAGSYADPEYVYQDLEEARKLMRKLGCLIIHTEGRAIEETAQEILGYYTRMHPIWTDEG